MLEPLEARVLLTTITVTTVADGGAGSLRQAILDANAGANADADTPDRIEFNIAGSGAQTITPASALPEITDPVVIDGYTQPGASPNTQADSDDAVRLIVIDGGANLSTDDTTGNGLQITGGGSTVRGLVIHRFRNNIRLTGEGGNVVEGNLLGLNAAGDAAPAGGSGRGILIDDSSDNTVGGTTPAARNVIGGESSAYGNQYGQDILIRRLTGTPTANVVVGNFIGLNAAGTASLVGAGIEIQSSDGNTIGGLDAGARNVVAPSGLGLNLFGSENTVQGNYFGLDPSGTTDLGGGGLLLQGASRDNLIGGAAAGAGNVIAGSDGAGIHIQSLFGLGAEETASGNTVAGNFIGTDATGTQPLANAGGGVVIEGNASNNAVGGTDPGAGNLIAFNAGAGVVVIGPTATGNSILGNSIHDNGLAGIDLDGDGATPNDAATDPDGGPNGLQNFPVILASQLDGGQLLVAGTLDSTPAMLFRVEFFATAAGDPQPLSEGQTFVGALDLLTDANGHASFENGFTAPAGGESVVTATATDSLGNTSEFSFADDGGGGTGTLLFGRQSPTGKTKATLTDVDGTRTVFFLKGPGIGTLTGADGDASFGLSFTGTTAKSTLVITTQKAAAGADNLVVLNGLTADATGSFKAITAGTTDLAGDATLPGTLGKLKLHDVITAGASGQRTFTLGGAGATAKSKATLSFGQISDLTLTSGEFIRKLTAAAWIEDATNAEPDGLTAPGVGSIAIKGNPTAQTRGDFEADVTTTDAALKLKRIAVKGLIQGAAIRTAGDLGGVVAGAFRDADIFAGVSDAAAAAALPDPNLLGDAKLTSLSVKGKPDAFPELNGFLSVNSNVAANSIGKVRLKLVDGASGTGPFGVEARSLRGYKRDAVRLGKLDLATPGDLDPLGNFLVRIAEEIAP